MSNVNKSKKPSKHSYHGYYEPFKVKEGNRRSRLERLESRMKSYRERSKEQQDRQSHGNIRVSKSSSTGFNLFCKELHPEDEKLAQTQKNSSASKLAILNFDESYFDSENNNVVVAKDAGNPAATTDDGGIGSAKCFRDENARNASPPKENKVPDPFSGLCWVCGQFFPNLREHASCQHFYDSLVENSRWELTETLQLK